MRAQLSLQPGSPAGRGLVKAHPRALSNRRQRPQLLIASVGGVLARAGQRARKRPRDDRSEQRLEPTQRVARSTVATQPLSPVMIASTVMER
ncbi:MAG: hypothetical protein ACLP8S_03445 [Solirubrobacteraceae bacterium]